MVRQWPLVAFRLGHFETFEEPRCRICDKLGFSLPKTRTLWNLAFAQKGSVGNSLNSTAILAGLRKIEFHNQRVCPPPFELAKQYEHEVCGVHEARCDLLMLDHY